MLETCVPFQSDDYDDYFFFCPQEGGLITKPVLSCTLGIKVQYCTTVSEFFACHWSKLRIRLALISYAVLCYYQNSERRFSHGFHGSEPNRGYTEYTVCVLGEGRGAYSKIVVFEGGGLNGA